MQPNYDLVAVNGADSLHLDSTMVNFLARLNTDGTLDTTYNFDLQQHRGKESVNGSIHRSILLPDGKLLIAGAFTRYNGQEVQRIARLHTDGSLDPTFKSSAGANFPIYDMAQQPDGKLIVTGPFTTYAGTTVPHVARITADGTLDPSLQVGAGSDGTIYNISVMPQGEIVLSGAFSKFNGIQRNNFVVLRPDGSLHPTYNTNGGINLGANDVNGAINKVLQLPGEQAMLAVGSFTKFDFRPCNRILRIQYR